MHPGIKEEWQTMNTELLDSFESLLCRLEQAVDSGMSNLLKESETWDNQELCNLLYTINQKLKDEKLLETKYRHLIRTFISRIPCSIAILDRDMNYLAVSDSWIADYKLENLDLIGSNHYEVFPEISPRWHQDYEDCLRGKIERLTREEDFLVREDGSIDWLHWQLFPWHSYDGQIGGLLIFTEIITEQKLLQQKIQSTEGQMRAVFAGMNELVFTIELNSDSILILPTKFFEIYDDAIVDEIINQTQNQLFYGNEAQDFQVLIHQVLNNQRAIDFEYSLQLDDSLIWFSVNISPVSESTVIWIARDITNRKETEQDMLYAEKELAQVTLQSIGDGVITTDAYGKVEYINPIAEQLTGWDAQEAKQQSLTKIFRLVNESTQEPIANPIKRVSRENKVCKLAGRNMLISRNNNKYAIEGLASPIKNRQDKMIGTVIVFRDVTFSRQMARKLSWQATHDPLTRLYNRRKFEDFVTLAIEDAHNHESNHVLCFLDLDRFKIINDTCGHAAGDQLLRQLTNLLQNKIRNSDIFARVGGDEFGLLFHRCPLDVAQKIANQLRQLVTDFRFVWNEDKVFRIGVSIGLVEIKSTTENLTSLFSAADAACYVAKQQGGNYVHVCHEQDLVVAQHQGERRWIEKINLALEENRFCLYAQKIVAIDEENCDRCHHEILLRLIDESGNITLPGMFLPAAERYGLMPAIDRWVISTFLAGYEVYCLSMPRPESTVAPNLYTINLSGASINNQEFGNFLREQFDRYSIPPQTICFEITETVAITNLENANALINQLKDLGCSIALDDFGSGMSSLTYLKNLSIDYLKIDGSFVTNIANDEVDYATVECFNHISKIMNIKTIAEFVENKIILQNLQKIGVDYAQGYGIERPQPLVWE